MFCVTKTCKLSHNTTKENQEEREKKRVNSLLSDSFFTNKTNSLIFHMKKRRVREKRIWKEYGKKRFLCKWFSLSLSLSLSQFIYLNLTVFSLLSSQTRERSPFPLFFLKFWQKLFQFTNFLLQATKNYFCFFFWSEAQNVSSYLTWKEEKNNTEKNKQSENKRGREGEEGEEEKVN